MAELLIVENDTVTANALYEFFSHYGFNTAAVSNGKEALNFLSTVTMLPATILLDILLPTIDGEEFLRHLNLNPKYDDIVVIAIAGVDSPSLASRDRVVHVIRKPGTVLDDLTSLLRTYCRHSA